MDSALLDRTSAPFLGQWRRLVSTTNWEKGQIIHRWREALRAGNAPAGEFSDDAWSQHVGFVTPQHVGRLRRVFERFGDVHGDYSGLYWSHFQAAIDWDDAEMWLEGAVRNDWSISQMRHERWTVLGQLAEQAPADESHDESLAAPWDEDAETGDDVVSGTLGVVRAPAGAGDDSAAEDGDQFDGDQFDGDQFDGEPVDEDAGAAPAAGPRETAGAASQAVRPFANLPALPADVADAFEAYKLCILRHKLAAWQEISRGDLLASLDALKQLALAPAEG